MFYMFPCPMHYGEFTWILFRFTSCKPCLCFLNRQNQKVDLVWCLLSLILMKLLGWSVNIYLISEVYTRMLYVWFWCVYTFCDLNYLQSCACCLIIPSSFCSVDQLMMAMSLCCCSLLLMSIPLINNFLKSFPLLQMCFNAFDKAADLDVLDHPILNFIYYLVSFGLQS